MSADATQRRPYANGEKPWAGRRMHLIGVGGAGMSAYARAAHALGAQVSGSDRESSPYLERLVAEGVLEAVIGHDPANLPEAVEVEVFYSSAIAPDNPERVAARERGLSERPRADLLGELTALRRTIAVAGAHGKTTTASMLVHALSSAGLDPGWLVGSSVGEGWPNSHWGGGEWLVVEADESDRSMLALHVEIAVVTNVELDHHATFASEAELREAFRAFLAAAPQAVIWNRADLLALRQGPLETFDADSAAPSAGGCSFMWRGLPVRLQVPGVHNALDAAAALEASRLAGADPHSAIAGVEAFRGAGRRFQAVGFTPAGARVIDDYAHHPTEVAATLRAARDLQPARLVAVFQPHLYSRTARLAPEFGRALALADVAAVLDVYPARERQESFPGVSGLLVAEAAADAAGGREVLWLPTFDDALKVLGDLLKRDDLCLVMGAGDVDLLARRLVAGAPGSGAHERRAPGSGPSERRAPGSGPPERRAPGSGPPERRAPGADVSGSGARPGEPGAHEPIRTEP